MYICANKNFNMEDFQKRRADILRDIHNYITSEAETLGISVSEVCRRANINRSVFQNWKGEQPKTLQMVCALLDVLDEVEVENGIEAAYEATT